MTSKQPNPKFLKTGKKIIFLTVISDSTFKYASFDVYIIMSIRPTVFCALLMAFWDMA